MQVQEVLQIAQTESLGVPEEEVGRAVRREEGVMHLNVELVCFAVRETKNTRLIFLVGGFTNHSVDSGHLVVGSLQLLRAPSYRLERHELIQKIVYQHWLHCRVRLHSE